MMRNFGPMDDVVRHVCFCSSFAVASVDQRVRLFNLCASFPTLTQHVNQSDVTFGDRWRCLQSVDDMVRPSADVANTCLLSSHMSYFYTNRPPFPGGGSSADA
jgi:hypothetical protein